MTRSDRSERNIASRPRARIAVVSPFLDKSHGTERIVVEWITQLANEFEIHVYSQQVCDVDLSKIAWHRIPKLPGPHLFNFLWWFAANRVWRWRDRRFGGKRYEVVFSPGVNCFDADVVSIHIVFAELWRRVGSQLALARNPVWFWPRLLHRKLYYRLVILLERHVFTNPRTQLILTSPRSAAELREFYRRQDRFPVICAGIDHKAYNPGRLALLRDHARTELGLMPNRFVLLLIGNDWHKKGIRVLFDALVLLRNLPVDVVVVGREDVSRFRAMVQERALGEQVHFLPPRGDVEFYYAAADVYAGPSLEDTFALPAFEAMACGLPVIISARAGAADFITHGVNGLILDDPTDAFALAAMVRRLLENTDIRERLGKAATEATRDFTWERSAGEVAAIFEGIARQKAESPTQIITQEP